MPLVPRAIYLQLKVMNYYRHTQQPQK